MAIAFNLPVEREPAADENYSRLNRLLAELYEVLFHILVARAGPESQDARRDRPYSESDLAIPGPSTQPEARRSATASPPAALHVDLDDEVFVAPHSETGNDRFATRNLEIFGARSPRTPAGVLLNPQREREFTFSASSEKQWRDKGGTDSADGNAQSAPAQADETDAVSESGENETTSIAGTIIRTIIPRKVSICTAIILMLGWKLLANR